VRGSVATPSGLRACGGRGHTAALTGHPLTLGALLDQEAFGLRLLTGAPDATARPVVGVHGTEVDHAVRWLDRDWVMLTTGLRLAGDADAQRTLVANAEEAGLAALGFGTGLTFDDVPPALLDEAAARGFPVFEVPEPVPFHRISAFAAQSVVSSDLYVLRRVVAVQHFLMEALQAGAPEEELVRRLSRVLDGEIALYSPDGRRQVTSRAGGAGAPADEERERAVWAGVCGRPAGLQRFDCAGATVTSAPVEADGRIRGWLVVVARRSSALDGLSRGVMDAACRLLGVVATARRITLAEEREQRALLFDAVVEGAPDAKVGEALAALGLDLAEPVRAVVVVPAQDAPAGSDALGELAARLEHACASRHVPALVRTRDDGVAVLHQGGPPPVEDWLAAGAELVPRLVAGVGRPATALADVARSHRDAALAVERLRRRPGAARGVLRFEDFDLTEWLLSEAAGDQLGAKVDEVLAALRAKPALHETVCAYLAADLDVGRAARALHVHPNSVRYRLGKVEELLGEPLSRPATISRLHLALTAEAARPRG
jgi:PucR family transcriptional regulator, purine catabolism regulatory protein